MSTCSSSSIDVHDDDLAELEAQQAAFADRLSALQAEQAVPDVAASQASAASALAAENATLRAQLAALESATANKSTSRRDGELAKQQAELDKMAAENARLSEALASGVGLSKLTTLRADPGDAVAASRARSLALSKSMSTSRASVTCSGMKSALKALDTKENGVDICLLMDGSGSMGWCLEACKAKALEIMSAAEAVHPDAQTRVACVIYRDFYNGPQVLETHDFVEKQNFEELTSFLSSVHAISNTDPCENVAGGLKEALGLSWRSSTKLLIYFGDAPAHGRQYHPNRMHGIQMLFSSYDLYPDGNPDGLVPERLVKQLCNNRVNYYFAQIDPSTVTMTDIFAKEYEHSQNAVFKILDRTANAATFIPLVVESIRDSMRRSAFFGSHKKTSSSAKGTAKPDPRTVFHSIL